MAEKKDIENRKDLMQIVRLFYDKLLADDTINYLFTEVAKIDLEPHLEILVDFWDHILFGSSTYRKNAMKPHLDLHTQSPLEEHHFKTWLRYFHESVDHYFEGEKAFIIKERAASIATVMRIKIMQQGLL